MKHRDRSTWALALGLALIGCDDPPETLAPIGFADGGLDGAVVPDAGLSDARTDAPRSGPVFAAISSDFQTATSVSLLDAQGNVAADDYVTSGSARAGLVTAISSDVDLPQHAGEPGVLVLLDRLRTDVVTRIRLADGKVLGQVKTHTPPTQATTTSYSSNPQDYVQLDAQTAWVTRAEPNLDPAAPRLDRGNDLLRIDPSTMARTGERIDLSALDAVVTPAGASAAVTLYARPTRIARAGRTLVVGTQRTPFDFAVRAMGDGAVALVDLDTRAVTPFVLDGLKNCAGVDEVAGDPDAVLVTCSGDYNADARATAGIALLVIAPGTARVAHLWRAQTDPATSPLTGSVVSLGGTQVAGTASDFAGTGADRVAVLDLASGAQTPVTSAAPGTGRFGRLTFDPSSGLLLVPDATVDGAKRPTAGIRRFQRNADGSFTELSTTRVSVGTGLPVRSVYAL